VVYPKNHVNDRFVSMFYPTNPVHGMADSFC
jgi:hypothetical protein